MQGRGAQKQFVDVLLVVDRTGDLIECGEKNGKESIEEKKSTGTTDGPGRGTDTGNQLFKGGGL